MRHIPFPFRTTFSWQERSIRDLLWAALCGFLFLAPVQASPGAVLQEWRFDVPDEAEGWDVTTNHVDEVSVSDGALQGRILDWDPFLRSPLFEIKASPWQVVEIRMKTDCPGDAEIFWTSTTETEYGGFSPGKETHFEVLDDEEWHVYRIFPFWQKEGKIILLRLDFPRPDSEDEGNVRFAVDWIRVVELDQPTRSEEISWDFSQPKLEWQVVGAAKNAPRTDGWLLRGEKNKNLLLTSPLTRFLAEEAGDWLILEMAVQKGETATVKWASEECSGTCSHTFPIQADGQFHLYNVDLGGTGGWSGDVMMLQLKPSDAQESRMVLKRLAVSETPQGPPEIRVLHAGLVDALVRAGESSLFQVTVVNRGGEPAENLFVKSLAFPGGVQADLASGENLFPTVLEQDTASLQIPVHTKRKTCGRYKLRLEGDGAPQEAFHGDFRVEPTLHLATAHSVPTPQPVKSAFEIGALYFPGWPAIDRWARIWPVCPERKPVLGWYDEGNPECVDWQIKWAVENGISFFLVDWYWHKGSQHLDHWIKAYKQSNHRSYLKWAMMWANHNPKGSHSEEDQRAVTQFWIDEYFPMPEYYRIENKPVVMIWSPSGMERDMKDQGGVARLLEISREMAREAGYEGIWFIAMKWPEASTEAKDIQWLADAGFDMTSIYHYMHHGGDAKNAKRFPFDLVAESSSPFWEARHETGILPFLPNLATGWDSRPWHGDKSTVIYGRTVKHFRHICREARRFAQKTDTRRLVLAPLNEWGEGSYAEPCQEFGFGMYEAVRAAFCEKPQGGWPLNYAPKDVGLGPYDLAMPEEIQRTSWDFTEGAEAWGPMMGIKDFKAEKGRLLFTCASADPAISTTIGSLDARQFESMVVRLKAEATTKDPGDLQLFWSTRTHSTSESASVKVPLMADGTFHDYTLPLSENRRWRGRITGLRLDTGSLEGLSFEIESIRLVRRPSAQPGE